LGSRAAGDWTIILFKHLGWKEPVEFITIAAPNGGVSAQPEVTARNREGRACANDLTIDSWE
jgi:hypothetical protein